MNKKISKFEKEWRRQQADAKKFEWDFSLPLKPALGQSEAWTPAKRKAVNGRIVTVGWADEVESTGIAFFIKKWNSELHILCSDGSVEQIWGPHQIISIGESINKVITK